MHRAASSFIGYSYDFCWPVRTLRVGGREGLWQARTPAMAAGLSDHVWSTKEWVTTPPNLVSHPQTPPKVETPR